MNDGGSGEERSGEERRGHSRSVDYSLPFATLTERLIMRLIPPPARPASLKIACASASHSNRLPIEEGGRGLVRPITVAGKEQMKHDVQLLSLPPSSDQCPLLPRPLARSLTHFLRTAFELELSNLKT